MRTTTELTAVRRARARRLAGGALLAALLTSIGLVLVTQLWDQPLHVPFQYTQAPGDDEQDATLELMLIKNIHETGWFNTNPKLNAPFAQHWAEWPMGGDLLAYTIKKGIVSATDDVPLTLNLFWLLTFPLTALVAFPVLRSLRCSAPTAVVGAVLFAMTPYHFRNGVGHSNLAFVVGIPVIVLLAVRMLGPPDAMPRLAQLRTRTAWRRLRWLLLGTVLVAVTGIYYLAFLVALTAICAVLGAIAHRRPGRLAVAALFGAVGVATSAIANLPTVLFRAQHPVNILGVPDRPPAVSELYPLRIAELLSPVTGHRLAPFAWVSEQLSERGRHGLGTANLGLAGSIGFVAATIAVLLWVTAGNRCHGWALEARLGVVMLVSLIVGMAGGLNRLFELLGLQGVRAWSRIAIVIAFAAIAVFARLLDRARVTWARRGHAIRRPAWYGVLVIVIVLGVLDQTSSVLLPNPRAHEATWRADAHFVAALERALPRDAMVFELPLADFPEHGAGRRMSEADPIKVGYLHSRSLRWSAGGIRGRSGEWQWPASALRLKGLVRGLAAMGFRGLTLDRYGYEQDARHEVHALNRLLGPPIARRGDRLVGWDLGRAAPTLLAGMDTRAQARLARRMLAAPRLYLRSDADPTTDRGEPHATCDRATMTMVNPSHRTVRRTLVTELSAPRSPVRAGVLHLDGRRFPVIADTLTRTPVLLRPGRTGASVTLRHPGIRCDDVVLDILPKVAAHFVPPDRAGERH